MLVMVVNFKGTPGSPRDKLCGEIFNAHGASFLGAGTFLPDARDVEYEVTEKQIEPLKRALAEKGFHDVQVVEEEDDEETNDA